MARAQLARDLDSLVETKASRLQGFPAAAKPGSPTQDCSCGGYFRHTPLWRALRGGYPRTSFRSPASMWPRAISVPLSAEGREGDPAPDGPTWLSPRWWRRAGAWLRPGGDPLTCPIVSLSSLEAVSVVERWDVRAGARAYFGPRPGVGSRAGDMMFDGVIPLGVSVAAARSFWAVHGGWRQRVFGSWPRRICVIEGLARAGRVHAGRSASSPSSRSVW